MERWKGAAKGPVMMNHDILDDFSSIESVKTSIKANWENYHYCLGRSPSVELSVGRYLTWLVTNMPDHFMNLVVCTELPSSGADQLIKNALLHFESLNIQKLSWLADEIVYAAEMKKHLVANGLTFRESFATEMAVDLDQLTGNPSLPDDLQITMVDDDAALRKWIRVASSGFGVPAEAEDIWFDFFNYVACGPPFRTYLALLNGTPVGTSQLFTSAGVAGIYNVACMPQMRGRGVGAAVTLAALLEARKLGYRVGILQASQMGYKVYRRLGFQDFGKLSVFLWENKTSA
jgi:GNAT superfamily N-acetyltransferase